jgi:type II secretory ATPase GspE/PulE/Tfp pilus assembly ATPase PilB-like protein
VRIRFRRDGVLSEYTQVSGQFRNAMVSRIKIMASLDISEKRRAQDGRINFQQFGPMKLELRVATIPTSEGLEDIVMRLLAAGEPLPLAKLGLRDPVWDGVAKLLERSFGLILVCGPTGSGKTTTLHSLLGVLNAPARKIWTAEDPIEISQAGLRQVQVNARISWTFAAAMRSFLRADPDVIMVGEMRDAETAATAIEASLTGHLVLSTLHTNSAPETVVRLLEMGMDPFSFADALIGVLAQRLARRLCEQCRTSRPASQEELAALAQEYCRDTPLEPEAVVAGWRTRLGGEPPVYQAAGCDRCRQTGYRGRVGLHELLVSTPDLRQRMQRKASASELRDEAIRSGMATLRQDGIEKSLLGLTDMHEVRAVAS